MAFCQYIPVLICRADAATVLILISFGDILLSGVSCDEYRVTTSALSLPRTNHLFSVLYTTYDDDTTNTELAAATILPHRAGRGLRENMAKIYWKSIMLYCGATKLFGAAIEWKFQWFFFWLGCACCAQTSPAQPRTQ